jgi:hypothetical protein
MHPCRIWQQQQLERCQVSMVSMIDARPSSGHSYRGVFVQSRSHHLGTQRLRAIIIHTFLAMPCHPHIQNAAATHVPAAASREDIEQILCLLGMKTSLWVQGPWQDWRKR